MSVFTDLRERLVALVFRAREEDALDEEIRFHLEMEAEANLRRGMTPGEARRRARLTLGGVEQTKEEVRDARGVRPVEDLVRDVRYAFRSFARTPGFTATVVVVLGLGIGATTSIFSAVRAVVLRPLPFTEPERLYMLWESNPEKGWERETAAPANFLDWKARVASFADVEAYSGFPSQAIITGLERPTAVTSVTVTGGFFSMLGVRPMLGRDFTEEETWASATWRAGEVPLLLSATTWRTVFGGDDSVIGTPVAYNGVAARVVGVMPEGFAFPDEDAQLWTPFGWADEARDAASFRRAHWIRPIARLTDGSTREQAAAELDAVAAQLEAEYPELNLRMGAGMSPLDDFLLGDARTPLMILLGAVGLMLLIACANVGNLLLVRASARHRALVVRAALGAGRGRLVRQMLTESSVLAAIGGGAGVALGAAGTRLLERLQPEGLLRVTSFPGGRRRDRLRRGGSGGCRDPVWHVPRPARLGGRPRRSSAGSRTGTERGAQGSERGRRPRRRRSGAGRAAGAGGGPPGSEHHGAAAGGSRVRFGRRACRHAQRPRRPILWAGAGHPVLRRGPEPRPRAPRCRVGRGLLDTPATGARLHQRFFHRRPRARRVRLGGRPAVGDPALLRDYGGAAPRRPPFHRG